MTTALAKRKKVQAEEFQLTPEDVTMLTTVGIIPTGTPANVVTFFGKTCGMMKLSPFRKQIHLIKRSVKVKKRIEGRDLETWEARYSIQTGIDGYRSRADSTGRYAGNDDYLYDDGKTEYEMIEIEGRTQPTTATAKVYKMVGGQRCAFSATAHWKEYCPKGEKESFMWFKMPFLMLGKTAEALALRKAFPNETAGVMVDEEMAHVNDPEAEAPQNAPGDWSPGENEPPPEMAGEENFEQAGEVQEAEVVPQQQSATRATRATQNARSAATRPAAAQPRETVKIEWRNSRVPYGKQKDKMLGELADSSVQWWFDNFVVETSYEKDGKTYQSKPENVKIQKDFRMALDAAGVEFGWSEK